jgi:hypothetical protein
MGMQRATDEVILVLRCPKFQSENEKPEDNTKYPEGPTRRKAQSEVINPTQRLHSIHAASAQRR